MHRFIFGDNHQSRCRHVQSGQWQDLLFPDTSLWWSNRPNDRHLSREQKAFLRFIDYSKPFVIIYDFNLLSPDVSRGFSSTSRPCNMCANIGLHLPPDNSRIILQVMPYFVLGDSPPPEFSHKMVGRDEDKRTATVSWAQHSPRTGRWYFVDRPSNISYKSFTSLLRWASWTREKKTVLQMIRHPFPLFVPFFFFLNLS